MRILITGGAGFIGSALVRHLIENNEHKVLNFDKLTYADTLSTVKRVAQSKRYRFSSRLTSATASSARHAGGVPPRHRRSSRGREPCQPLD